ncbi:MAG: hypothetical protein ACI4PM_02060 [Butyricicoccus sp.]
MPNTDFGFKTICFLSEFVGLTQKFKDVFVEKVQGFCAMQRVLPFDEEIERKKQGRERKQEQ